MRVDELINKKVFRQGFEQSKEILDGKYVLVAKHGYIPYTSKPTYESPQFRIEVKTKKGVVVGWVNYENKDDNLEALDLFVHENHRRKGIASEMYKFARELGNDIRPSPKQTALGKKFWSVKDHSK